MKLSEAIRLGAMLKPKGIGFLNDLDGHTCALGAACEAVGIPIAVGQQSLNNATFKRWPVLRMRVKPPVIDTQRRGVASVSTIIQSLNDSAEWSREQIADWVETIEVQQETQTVHAELQPAAGGTEAR